VFSNERENGSNGNSPRPPRFRPLVFAEDFRESRGPSGICRKIGVITRDSRIFIAAIVRKLDAIQCIQRMPLGGTFVAPESNIPQCPRNQERSFRFSRSRRCLKSQSDPMTARDNARSMTRSGSTFSISRSIASFADDRDYCVLSRPATPQKTNEKTDLASIARSYESDLAKCASFLSLRVSGKRIPELSALVASRIAEGTYNDSLIDPYLLRVKTRRVLARTLSELRVNWLRFANRLDPIATMARKTRLHIGQGRELAARIRPPKARLPSFKDRSSHTRARARTCVLSFVLWPRPYVSQYATDRLTIPTLHVN